MQTPQAILDSARGERCTFRIAGPWICDPETVVCCHLPDGSGGSNRLTGPLSFAYGCNHCHDRIDGRVYYEFGPGDKEFYMRRAHNRTLNRLIAKGLITVKGL